MYLSNSTEYFVKSCNNNKMLLVNLNLFPNNHIFIEFDGPKGQFDLKMPKNTTFLLEGEATVENLSTEIIKMLSYKMPENVQAIGVYIYEGVNKGAHILSSIKK